MRRVVIIGMILSATGLALIAPLSVRAGVFDHLWPHSGPPTLTDVARAIDCIQEALVNQGTVSVKQPDIWSQGRMTKFRKEFEDQLEDEIKNFEPRLAARIARSDAANLASSTDLAASITPAVPGSAAANPQFTTLDQVTKERDAATALLPSSTSPGAPDFLPSTSTVADFTLLNKLSPTVGTILAPNGTASAAVGLEPNVYVDQKADHITHVQRIRRINLGDDNSDSAGYGLYLMRLPISIQPGDKTNKGFGALVNLTMSHDFGPRFLQSTYRNLVINDLVDQLSPVIHELIRSGQADKYHSSLEQKVASSLPDPLKKKYYLNNNPDLFDRLKTRSLTVASTDAALRPGIEQELHTLVQESASQSIKSIAPISRIDTQSFAVAPSDVPRVFLTSNLLNIAFNVQTSLGLNSQISLGISTKSNDSSADSTAPQPTPKDGSQVDFNAVRMTEVRSYLRQELQSAYDLMEGRCKEQVVPILGDAEYIESLTDMVYCRKYEDDKRSKTNPDEERNIFETHYDNFTHRLPGNLDVRPIGMLSWAIAIQAGLLNRQLHDDMKQVKGPEGWVAPPEVETMNFYLPEVAPEIELTFQEYIKARWPMITFALDPNVDQQNIEDSFTRRRDLQLAVSFALVSGRISFRQATKFQRQLQYEAETIALNQTVAAFANGNDTFGWRISPRFQTPPEESNIRAVANLLLQGGPGPNYGLKNSKIEPGMREMTAVVVMPSFVRGMRLDISSDWYRLSDPDERKVHTAKSVELGRRINEARDNLETACQCAKYRPEDVNRLRAKLHQLETMLPLQTSFVKIPYENTLGGMALFTQGAEALVPELNGFEGIEYADIENGFDVIVYGKHFSQYETAIVVGGKNLPRAGTELKLASGTDASTVTFVHSLDPPRDKMGNLLVARSDGTWASPTPAIQDPGVFDILSREIIRLRIPPNVKTVTRSDKTEHVEIFLSTPNGISNKLEIPLQPKEAPPADPDFSPLSENPGLTLDQTLLTIRAAYDPKAKKYVRETFRNPTQLRIYPTGPAPNVAAGDTASVRFVFQLSDDNKVVSPIVIPKVAYDASTKGFTLDAKQLNDLTKQLFELIDPKAVIALTTDTQLKTVRIEVQLPPAANATQIPPIIPTSNQLTFKFEIFLQTSSLPGGKKTIAAAKSTKNVGPQVSAKGRDPMTKQVATTQADEASDYVPEPLPPLPPSTTVPPIDGEVEKSQAAAPVINFPGGSFQVDGPTSTDGVSVQLKGNAAVPIPGTSQSVTLPGTLNLPLSQTRTAAAATATPAPQTIVVSPGQPNINVSVPVTNIARQPKQHSLFHRNKAPISPQNPTKPPLLERLLNRP